MPSSISSSDHGHDDYWVRPMAERTAPPIAWVHALLVALVIIVAGVAAWEVAMRGEGLSTRDLGNSDSAWARERRRVDAVPGTPVIIGSSRLLFDVDTVLWGQSTGTQPIQLAREGTNPRPVLTDLARDAKVTGLVVVGYDPMVFWRSAGRARKMVDEARREPLYKRVDLAIYDRLARVFAYLDDSFTPLALLEHLDVPQRTARGNFNQPWKLAETGERRDTWMWPRVENDAEYRKRAASIWLLPPPPGSKPAIQSDKAHAIAEVARDVKAIRARGGEVVFVRSPSDPPLLTVENKVHPRALWDRLLAASGSRGIYWADDPVLAKLHTVELSHLGRADRAPFTRRLIALVAPDLAAHDPRRARAEPATASRCRRERRPDGAGGADGACPPR